MAKFNKLTAGLTIAGLVVGGVIAGFACDDSSDVDRLTAELADLKAQGPIIETVEVEVDNGNLDLVLDHIYDNKGDVDYLTEDLDDDEVEQVVDRITFINEIKDLAVAEVKAEVADEIDGTQNVTMLDNSTTQVEFDEDDIERIRVQDDGDEVIVDDVDFEDNDAEVKTTVNFEQDGIKFAADFMVEFKDSEVDDLNLLVIRER